MTSIFRSETGIVLPWIMMWLILPTLLLFSSGIGASKTERLPFIDISAHLHGAMPMGESDFQGAAMKALRAMDKAGIRQTILIPPPLHTTTDRATMKRPCDRSV
jgi:hypothetical protein